MAANTVDVVVVGAGLAGLAAARAVHRAGLEVLVIESSDDVGGRVRTDLVDGLRLDRGFQLYNPAYPEGMRVLDHAALDLRPLAAGVIVAQGDRHLRLGDPRRQPGWSLRSATCPVGSPLDKLRFAAYAVQCAARSPERLLARADVSSLEALESAGIHGALLDSVIRPFLAGVFLEEELSTSRHFLDLVLRSFVRGTPSLPAAGMGAIPHQLAAQLPPDAIVLNSPAIRVSAGIVVHDQGSTQARAVIVATDLGSATVLVPSVTPRRQNDVTTWYHTASVPGGQLLGGSPSLVIDAHRNGPLINSAVISNAAPEYATAGRSLISSSALGLRSSNADERAARAHAARMYGIDPASLEHVRTYAIRDALPSMPPPLPIRRPVRVSQGLYVAGDHRDTSSIQGALVSGRRAAHAALRDEFGIDSVRRKETP